jgi:hypothetical protein
MEPLSVAEQDEFIRASFPDFRLCCDGVFVGAWEGALTPNCRTYRIGIVYYPTKFFFKFGVISSPWVTVRVLSPEIGLDPRGTGEPPPHIFREKDDRFSLCLYDGRMDEWSLDLRIADTIIPWAADWLFYFEAWLHSGVWTGGGAHPGDRKTECHTSSPSFRVPQDRSLAAASSRIGRLIGTSASFRLMAAASGDFSLLEFFPISKPAWADPPPSPTTLIWPQARRPEEFLLSA